MLIQEWHYIMNYKFQYTDKIDILTYFIGTNRVDVLSSDFIYSPIMSTSKLKYKQ